MMKPIKALILDAGGVMVHPIHGNWSIPAGYKAILGNRADNISREAYLAACEKEFPNFLNEDRYLNVHSEYINKYDFLKAVASRLELKADEATLLRLTEDFTYNGDRYAWYDDTDEVLTHLHRSYKIGVLSDAMPSFRRVLEEHDAKLGNFDAISISCEVGCAKPNPKMYEDIVNKLMIPAENCLFTDDRVCNLEGAQAVGMQVVQMCRDGLPAWNGPAVHSLSELKAYVEAMK